MRTSCSTTLGKTRHRRSLLSVALASFVWLGCSLPPDPAPSPLFTGATMGTTYAVTVAATVTEPEASRIHETIHTTLTEIDAAMSTYDERSELSRFNRSQETSWVDVSPDLFRVLRHALDISDVTDGAFDVTVGPLVNAWGFGPTDRTDAVPTAEDVEGLLANVGHTQVHIDPESARLKKEQADIEIDLSALAKGYGVDRVAEALDTAGYDSYLIEVGGEVRARGYRLDGRRWRVGIEQPTDGAMRLQRVIELRDAALATSGDYRNYFEADGRRYSHTIDPRTGYPVAHRLASASVVASECVIADALATALAVLGPDEGYRLADAKGWAALLVVREEDGRFTERATPAFLAMTGD